jgi:hypothetical protein
MAIFVLDDGPACSVVCTYCDNFDNSADKACKAFPDGIPNAIWSGKNKYLGAISGDHGYRFVLRPDFTFKHNWMK